MPDLQVSEILTQLHKRGYIQYGGARPTNPVAYAGQDAQYMSIDGLSISEIGGIDPIWVPDPNNRAGYRLVGRSLSPADLPTVTLNLREKRGSIPRQLTYIGCPLNIYEATGACGDLSDFIHGWTDYVLIYEGGIVTTKDGGTRTGFDSDDPIEDALEITLGAAYPIGGLSFAEGGSTQIDREVVDVVYQGKLNCGNCGPYTDGTQRIYAITKSSGGSSPGLPAEVVYTLDGGLTWNQTNITGIGASEDPLAIDIVGVNLVVLAGTAAIPAYYYAELDAFTGAPGTFTKVTNGFVANKQAYDLFVLSPRETFLVGQGGYIYKMIDATSGVTIQSAGDATTNDLKRIHGEGDTMIAGGQSGTIIKSINRGRTWATTTTTPTISVVQAVCVMDQYRYWIGHSAGRVYYTTDGGATWVEKAFGDSGTGQVYDIVFPTQSVGFILYTNATPAGKIIATFNGGADFALGAPRILNNPTTTRETRMAYPRNMDASIMANNVAVAGLSGGGTDGILLVGVAVRL